MKWGALLIAGLLFAVPAYAADEPPICAARPGKATPACTVPAGQAQIETGLIDWSRYAGETSVAVGETAFKFGLSDSSDIEIDVTPWQRTGGIDGFGDVTFAYKQRLTAPGAPVEAALMPVVKLPTAGHVLGNGQWEGGLLLPVSHAFAGTPLSLGVTPELDWVADGDGYGHHVAMAQVASLGFAVSDRLTLSAEIWGQWDWDPAGTDRQASADASIAFLVSKRVQLDAGGNFGLNDQTSDVELYAGVSARF